jgi:uncharacterized membrane protein
MDRYHIIKVSIVALAIVAAVAGTSMTTTSSRHSSSIDTRFAAAAQVQSAAWQATLAVGHLVGHAFCRY